MYEISEINPRKTQRNFEHKIFGNLEISKFENCGNVRSDISDMLEFNYLKFGNLEILKS